MSVLYVIKQLLRKIDFLNHFLDKLPKPDFNFKGHFYEKEFIEHTELPRAGIAGVTGRI
jgi:hypothetical protein